MLHFLLQAHEYDLVTLEHAFLYALGKLVVLHGFVLCAFVWDQVEHPFFRQID